MKGEALRVACLLLVCAASSATAQESRFTYAGDVSATVGSADPGFFNYTDYEHSALRMLRIDLSGAWHTNEHVSFLGEVRTENFDEIEPYAAYVRIRPWKDRDFDIQAGRVPPTFGGFARRTYATDNPLIGYPLAYQYLTSIRPDSLPATAAELVRKKGLGWEDVFSIGSQVRDRGVPLVSAFRWDTGVQVHAATHDKMFAATASITTGTVSNPLFKDDNSGRQLAGRFETRPVVGLVIGVSGARGPFVTSDAARAAVGDGHESDLTQTAWGVDVEYSRDHYLVRLESIASDWTLPLVRQPFLQLPLRAVSTSVEGRYKIAPGFYVAARIDHLGFSDVDPGTGATPWDAPVSRLEMGGGVSIQRNLLLKLVYQYNTRDGGPLDHTAHQSAAQLVFWF
ncbi:MAG TPA: hypothetical protein VFA59_08335 [Vicinamibacterales bacterium]|nr:hypothetical protein [Vicinamibacterales bacterium]